jgi:hypothetical protein
MDAKLWKLNLQNGDEYVIRTNHNGKERSNASIFVSVALHVEDVANRLHIDMFLFYDRRSNRRIFISWLHCHFNQLKTKKTPRGATSIFRRSGGGPFTGAVGCNFLSRKVSNILTETVNRIVTLQTTRE